MPMTLQISVTLTDEQVAVFSAMIAQNLGRVSENPLTISEFAAAVKESRSTIHNKVKAGIIVKSKVPGITRIPHSELERYRNGGRPPK